MSEKLRTTRRFLPPLVPLAAILALLPAGAHAMGNKEKPKRPDLVVTSGGIEGRRYVFEGGEASPLSFTATTKNRGHGLAPASETGLRFIAARGEGLPPGIRPPAFRAAVGRLRPGHREHGGVPTRGFAVAGHPLGAWAVDICADIANQVKESNEHNNCRRVTDLYVFTKRQWSGHTSGNVIIDLAPGTWSESFDGDVNLEFRQYLGEGVFSYAVTGTVGYHMALVGSDCVGSGQGNVGVAPGSRVRLDYGDEVYSGSSDVPQNSLSFTVTCGDSSSTARGPRGSKFFVVVDSGGAQQAPLPFGTKVLEGSGHLDQSPMRAEWSWKFN